jgi:predicted permease
MAAAFALILASLFAGHLCARFRVLPGSSADAFNRFVIYVCLPAVVLRLVPKLGWQPGLLVLVLAPWLAAVCSVGLVLVAARAFGFRREVTGALLVCVPLGNTSFLGFPMIGALLGAPAIGHAVIYDQLGSFLLLATYGLYVVARFSGEAEPSVRSIVRRVAAFPPFIALLLALVPAQHPPLLDDVLARLGDALVPVALFAVGLKLELRRPRDGTALALGLSIKMLCAPLLVFAFTRTLSSPALPARVAVLESAMPPMITAGALAAMAGLAPELSAALVAYGVLFALVSLPAWSAFLSRV